MATADENNTTTPTDEDESTMNKTMCSKCGEGKDKNEFTKSQLKKSAATRKCRACTAASSETPENGKEKSPVEAVNPPQQVDSNDNADAKSNQESPDQDVAAQLKEEEAAEEARLKAEKEAQEAATLKAEAEAKELQLKAQEEARLEAQAAEELRLKNEEARIKAETEAKEIQAKAEEDARLEAEAAEQIRLQEEAAALLKAETEAKEVQIKAEEEARLKTEAEEEARLKTEAEAKEMQEKAEQIRLKDEEEAARIKAEVEAKEIQVQAEAEKAKIEAEAAEQIRLNKEEEKARIRAEVVVKALKEAKAAQAVEEAARLKAEEERNRQLADEEKAAHEEASRAAIEMQARKRAEEMAKRKKLEKEAAAAAEQSTPPQSVTLEGSGDIDSSFEEVGTPHTGVTFESAFGSNPRPTSLFTPRNSRSGEQEFKTPKESGASSSTPTPLTAPLTADSNMTQQSDADSMSDSVLDNSSQTALGARNKRRVSNKMNAYLEQARKHQASELPADKMSPRTPVGGRKLIFPNADQPGKPSSESPVSPQGRRSSLEMESIRAKFNDPNRSSKTQFVYGEAFRQKQKTLKETDKIKGKEAASVARGFDVLVLDSGKAEMGEVDASHLDKTFVFQGNSQVQLHDGACKVDYMNTTYESYVFMVHRTRGLLLLKQSKDPTAPQYVVPGGSVRDDEFLNAAKLTGSESVQLQLAAREGAARELHMETGIDIRQKLDRLKPAVLRMDPLVVDDKIILKNENGNKLYYFLQVEENDFPTEVIEGKSLQGPVDEIDVANSPLRLLLSEEFEGFRFAREPKDAAGFLQDHDDGKSSIALTLVMNQAADTPVPEARINSVAQGGPKHVPRDIATSQLDEIQMPALGNASKLPKKANLDASHGSANVPFDEKRESKAYDHEKELAAAEGKLNEIIGEGEGAQPNTSRSMNTKTISDKADDKGVTYEQVGQQTGMCCGCVIQ